jgi:Flp pilus assembly protein TadG
MNILERIAMPILELARWPSRAMRVKGEEGNALIELAIALPVVLALLTGAASFSMAFYNLQQLETATSFAAQQLAGSQSLTSDPCASVQTWVTQMLPNWSASKFTYTVVITNSTNTFGPTTGSSFSCKSGAADLTANQPVTVTVTYAYSWLPILKWSTLSGITATASGIVD